MGGQRADDRGGGGVVAGALGDVVPEDAAVGVDDEDAALLLDVALGAGGLTVAAEEGA